MLSNFSTCSFKPIIIKKNNKLEGSVAKNKKYKVLLGILAVIIVIVIFIIGFFKSHWELASSLYLINAPAKCGTRNSHGSKRFYVGDERKKTLKRHLPKRPRERTTRPGP